MRFVMPEFFLNPGGDLIAIGLAGVAHHAHPAERVAGALERLVGLQADDDLVFPIQIARAERVNRDNGFGIDIQHAALFAFRREQGREFFAHPHGAFGRGCEEGAVAVIGGVVFLNKVADVDLFLPIAAGEVVPCVH